MSDWFTERGNGGPVDVQAFFDSSVPGLLAEIVSFGVFVGFGRTRDGGAICVSVTSDGRNRKEYFRESGDCADWLLGARNALSGQNGQTVAPVPAPPARRPRKRP